MDITFLIARFLIGCVGSFMSSTLGTRGSIIKYLMPLYIPPPFGQAAFSLP